MTSPTVGAVIPVRNRWNKTSRFLERFRKQTYSNLRIYVVDSNSSDSTRDTLKLMDDGTNLLYVEASDEDFWAGATNRGIERALRDGCEYVLTINDDCVPMNGLIERLVATSQRTGCRLVGSRINYLQDPERVWSVGSYNKWGTHLLFQLREYDVCEDELKYRADYAVGYAEVDLMPGNGVLIHRTVFESVGLYDEHHYPHYHADSELVLRAKKLGGFQAIVDYHAVVYNDVSVTKPSNYLINRPVSWWRRRLQLFLSKRSERRILTFLHYLYHYCPPKHRLASALLYPAHAVVHFHLPRVKRAFLRIYGKYSRLPPVAWRVLSRPKSVLQLAKAIVRRRMAQRVLQRRRASSFVLDGKVDGK